MKMKPVLLVCSLVMMAAGAFGQTPQGLTVWAIANKTNGLPYCGAIYQSVTFTASLGTSYFGTEVALPQSYFWDTSNGVPFCSQPVTYNSVAFFTSGLRKFPTYMNIRVDELVQPVFPLNSFREVSNLLYYATPATNNQIIHRTTTPVAPHESGTFQVVDGYIVYTEIDIPVLPINGFFTYNNAARGTSDKAGAFCFGETMYVDTYYKTPAQIVSGSRFRYEYKMRGKAPVYYTADNANGIMPINTGDVTPNDPTDSASVWLKVQMIGPAIPDGEGDTFDGMLGPWSPAQKITIYPKPPQVNTTGLNPGTPLSDHASLTEKSSDNSVELHHIKCNGNNDGQVIISKLNTTSGYHVFVKNLTTSETMDYKAFWSPSTGHPVTLPDDAYNDPTHANTSFRFRAGTYEIRIQSINPVTQLDFGCASTQTFTIKNPAPLQVAASPTNYHGFNVSCFADNGTGQPSADAQVNVNPTGGIIPYTFTLNSMIGAGTGPIRQLTAPGNSQFGLLPAIQGLFQVQYSVSAVDAEGCIASVTNPNITMTVPPKITIDEVDVDSAANHFYNIRCFGGVGDGQVYLNGGTHTFTTWVDGNGYSNYQNRNNIHENIDQVMYTGLTAGNYTVHALDLNGCHSTLNFTFIQPAKLDIESSVITPVDCFGNNTGSIKVNGIGGVPLPGGQLYKYSLAGFPDQSGIDATFSPLVKGTYNIVISDVLNCSQVYPMLVAEPSVITLATLSTDVICFGNTSGTSKATFSGGTTPYSLEWLDGAKNNIATIPIATAGTNTITNRGAGQYYARISDARSCVKESVFFIAQPTAALDITAAPADILGITCNGMHDGKVTLQTSGGWQPYSIGESLTSLQPNALVRTDLTPGNHTFYVSDFKGCVDSFDVVIDEPAPLVVSPTDLQPVSCFGDDDGAFTPTITGGTAPYQMFDPGMGWIAPERISALTAGNLTLMVRDSRSCTANANIVILTPQVLMAQLASVTDTRCGETNGSAQVDVTGGTLPYSATWTLSGQVVNTDLNPTALPAGIYNVVISDSKNCKSAFNAGISASDGAVITIQDTGAVTCFGGNNGDASVDISGGTLPYSAIKWSTGEQGLSATMLIAGPNFVSVTDNVGCVATKQVDITGPAEIVGVFDATLPTCFGDSNGRLKVDADGGTGPYTYQWVGTSNTTNTARSLAAGDYNLAITDSKGCESVIQYDLEEPNPVSVQLSGESLLCTGQTVTLDAGNPGSTYKWTSTNGFTSADRTIVASKSGSYTVVVTDVTGCKGTDTFDLRVESNILKADFIATSEAFVGDTVVLINISFPLPDSSYWTFPDGGDVVRTTYYTQEVVFDEPGLYTALLFANKGECRDHHEGTINVIEEDTAQDSNATPGRKESLIRSFEIHPNPSDGKFTITVDLEEPEPIAVDIISVTTVSTQARYSDYDKDHYELNVSLNVSAGLYTVVLMAGKERLVRRIIIY